MSTASSLIAPAQAGPTAFQLTRLLNYLLGDWDLSPAQPAGRPSPGPFDLDLEYSVSLDGPYRCFLNLRTTVAFAKELAYSTHGENGLPLSPAEAFKTYCHAMATQFSVVFLNGNPQRLDGLELQSTRPSQWPFHTPDLELALLYHDQPIEARLWIAPNDLSGFPTKFPGLT